MLAIRWRASRAASPFGGLTFVTVDYSKHTRSILLVSGHAQAAACLLSAVCVNLGGGVAPLPFGIVCSLRCTKAVKILTTASNLPLRTYTPRKLFTASRHAAGGGSGKYSEIWRDRDSRRRGDGSTSYERAGGGRPATDRTADVPDHVTGNVLLLVYSTV